MSGQRDATHPFRGFDVFAGIATVTIGSLVLAGWLFRIDPLKSFHPSLVSMKPNTAVAFILTGVALLLLRRPGGPARRMRAGRWLAATVGAIGALTLAEHALALDLGIDTLLFTAEVRAERAPHPGRMAPIAALDFTMLGSSLLLLDHRGRQGQRPAQWLALAVGATALIAVIGYVFSIKSLQAVGPFASLSLPTAFGFLVLPRGILTVRMHEGIMEGVASPTNAGLLIRRLLPVGTWATMVLAWLRLKGEEAGFYDGRFGLALFTVANIGLLSALTFWTAGALRRYEAERDLAEAAHKRAEEALREKEVQLRQTQKMEEIGRLAGGVAHDFNNLLSVVLGYANLVTAELKPGDPLRNDVGEIRRAAERAADLTHQLLAFSRQQILSPAVLDLNEVVSGMIKMLRRLIGEDVELALLTRPDAGRVLLDQGQVAQVLLNLAVNARDAMPLGGKLTIETANVELDAEYAASHLEVTPGPHVLLSISDTGEGMDKATLARIFEPFFTTKEKGKGTGLGLAVVFGIVKQSGGHIWVYSEPGQGTTFKLYFPRVELPATPNDEWEETTATLSGKETILLAEDEEQLRHLASRVLRRSGYQVLEAQNGQDALRICQEHSGAIDLLVTDVVMPKMSGAQLAASLAGARPAMKVLFMSGYTDDAVVHHGVLESAVAFLQKPLVPDTLLRKVRSVLDGAYKPSDRPARSDTFKPAAGGEPGAAEEPAPQRERVLAIDDDSDIAQMLPRLLCPRYDLVVEHEGSAALERLRAGESYDLILCDVTMPQMSGGQVYRAVLAEQPEMARRIVFMSGGGVDADERSGIPANHATIAKPFSRARLVGAVEHHVARLRAEEGA